jgi:hypothetical protein
MLLITPYAAFFGLKLNGRFLFLIASAHLVFGIALGLYYWKRLATFLGGSLSGGKILTAAGDGEFTVFDAFGGD